MEIRFASLKVDDQERALRFYTTVLGFSKMADLSMGPFRWLTVVSKEGAEGVELVLEPLGFPPAIAYQKAAFEAGIPAAGFITRDIAADFKRMTDLGVVFRGEPKEMGPITAVLFEDTCGNVLNLVQPHSPVPNTIETSAVLKAPHDRVWRAISDAKEFGSWFGVEFDGRFIAGARTTGRITPTTVDAAVAATQEPYRGTKFEITIDRILPPTTLSFHWRPFAIDPAVDYSREPMTLVTFELSDTPDGTLLRLTESGFDGIPIERRVAAFRANEGGWAAQMTLIAKYLELAKER